MKRRESICELEKMGCVFIRHGEKHDWYQNSNKRISQPVRATGKSKIRWQSTFLKCPEIELRAAHVSMSHWKFF